ncbi:MAG TPA: TonB-dependent receptor [Vicinamibacterales bacterium]|nr:TonB-dependent receptor [Vicinamibacterales bacterium]
MNDCIPRLSPWTRAILLLASVASPLAHAQEAAPAAAEQPAATEAQAPAAALAPSDSVASSEASPDAIAVSQPAAEPSEESGTPTPHGGMQEIIVTAQKREQNLQDVPISVQAFTGDALADKGVKNPTDLQLQIPGMKYNIIAGYTVIFIRGVGTDAFIPSADPSVATYIDNVYHPFTQGLAAALGSIERIEVLKGPQGTLFGRNTTGGAINIVTKEPGSEFETNVELEGANYQRQNIRVYSNIPLADSLAVSVSGLYYSEDSFYDLMDDSVVTSLDKDKSKAFKVRAKWMPFDDFSILGSVGYISSAGSTAQIFPGYPTRPIGVALGVREAPDYKIRASSEPFWDTAARDYSLDMKWGLGALDTRLILAKQKVIAPQQVDYDGTNAPIAAFNTTLGQFADVKTGELQFISNDETIGADWLNWIAGGYYIESKAGYDPLLFMAAPDALNYVAALPGVENTGLVQILIPALNDVLGENFANRGAAVVAFRGVLQTKAASAFAQATGKLTDHISLTLGARYQDETKKLLKSSFGISEDPDHPADEVVVRDFGQRSHTTKNLSPKVVLDYKSDSDDLYYASWTKGFKSGTFNIISLTKQGFVRPEEVVTYEVGYKGEFFDHTLRLNTAVFQNEISDLQVQIISLLSGGAARFENAGKARIRGAEFDLAAVPMPTLLPGLNLTASGTYLDGKYTKFPNGSGFDPTTGIYRDSAFDYTGNKIASTPKWSGNVGFTYDMEMGPGQLTFGSELYYNGGFYFGSQNLPSSKEDAFEVLSARVSYDYTPWGLKLTVFGNNITEAKYHQSIQEYDFSTVKLLAAPATYGLRVNWSF